MKKQDLFKEIGFIDEDLIQEADKMKKDLIQEKVKMKKTNFTKKFFMEITAVAACLILILGIGFSIGYYQYNKIDLKYSSKNVSARYIRIIPNYSIHKDLIELTEEELITKSNTEIFKGTITEIKNIKININGSKEYNAIAKIKVEKVYRGSCRTDEIVSVVLPCPVTEGYWVEDTETVSQMKSGMKGIFMPFRYDSNSYCETNGARLYYSDLAEYGFSDGSRFAFLENENGLIFSKWAYSSISNATDLEQIEEYILKMIK